MTRALVFLAVLVACTAAVEGLRRLGFPVQQLTRDPSVTPGDSPFRGGASNVGLLLWAAGATACLLAARVVGPGRRTFLVITGVGVLALALDDALLLHEEAAERVLGAEEWQVYAIDLVLVLLWLRRFATEIARSDGLLLAMSAFAFAVSVGVDVVPGSGPAVEVAEDTAKYVGLVVLCRWCVLTALAHLSACRHDGIADGPR